MDAQTFLNKYQGQSLLWAANANREFLRGQCVQAVCFYVHENGKPIMWRDAAEWWYSGLYPDHYERIPNSPTAVPQPGDIIIWDRSLANSGGAGHIAICLYPRPGTGTFVSVDSNWGGKQLKAVTHDYHKVIGWLRIKGQAPAPQPAPVPTKGDIRMSPQEEQEAYQIVLERNWDGATGRTGIAFMRDARKELADRRTNQTSQVNALSATINQLNQTITNLQLAEANEDINEAEKQKKLDVAHVQIAKLTADLTHTTDQIKVVQKQPEPVIIGSKPETKERISLFIRILSKLLPSRKK